MEPGLGWQDCHPFVIRHLLRPSAARPVLPRRRIRRIEERAVAVRGWKSVQSGGYARRVELERDQHFPGDSYDQLVSTRYSGLSAEPAAI